MKFETTPAFDRDFKHLPQNHQQKFRTLVPEFNAAAEKAADGDDKPWPNGMRVKTVKGSSGVWELTWSMSDPDGRATWEWVKTEGDDAVRWRRVGNHKVLDNP